ncbi:hypothetical protein GCM10010517_26670 [Streptosporangium fragile]|uniref:Capsular polysaccharide biosynthesis protein n=1 Tax=Streptosporangium fragile TaxID=46186 RepID=A0ABP6IEI6_9ACTN
MEFWKTVLDLARRKRIGPPVIGLGLLAAAVVFFLVPPRYVSTASMVLTTPPAGGTTDPTKPPGRSNPLLQFSDGLRTTAGILILALNTEAVAAELGVVKDGPTEVTINDGRSNPAMLGILMNGPFVYVEVESDSAETAHTVMVRVQNRLRTELADRQRALGAPGSTFIGLVEVVPPTFPETDRSVTWQAAGGALALVVVLGLGLAYAVERRRSLRHRYGEGRPGVPGPATRAAGTGAEERGGREDGGTPDGADPPVTVYGPAEIPPARPGTAPDEPPAPRGGEPPGGNPAPGAAGVDRAGGQDPDAAVASHAGGDDPGM